jgi:hypothetical protein
MTAPKGNYLVCKRLAGHAAAATRFSFNELNQALVSLACFNGETKT